TLWKAGQRPQLNRPFRRRLRSARRRQADRDNAAEVGRGDAGRVRAPAGRELEAAEVVAGERLELVGARLGGVVVAELAVEPPDLEMPLELGLLLHVLQRVDGLLVADEGRRGDIALAVRRAG